MKHLALLLPCIFIAGCATSPKAIQHPRNVNGAMPALGQHDPRVVFIGDQQTYVWISAVQANHPLWINAATNAPETSASMLARFQTDVIDQHPDVVHILAGLEDINQEQDGGPAFMPCVDPDAGTCANISTMVSEARAAGIYVILGSIPKDPTSEYDTETFEVFDYDDYLLKAYNTSVTTSTPLPYAFVNYEDDVQDGWTDDGTLPNSTGINTLTTDAVIAIQACNCGGIR